MLSADAIHSVLNPLGKMTSALHVYTGEFVAPTSLSLRLRRKPFMCVPVIDNGKGMTEEVRKPAIEPFFTSKGEEGTGFGLSQTYAMMQQLGGDLTIESRVGAGNAVHLCLPAQTPST